LVLASALAVASAQEKKSDKRSARRPSETLQKAGEKVKQTGQAVADTTKKAADTVVDAVTPDKDAHKVDVKLVEHRIEMPKASRHREDGVRCSQCRQGEAQFRDRRRGDREKVYDQSLT
jgi:hypothetical protein